MTHEQLSLTDFPQTDTPLEQSWLQLPENPSRAERLAAIYQNYGFYPESLDELTRATALQAFDHLRHPAVRHLGEIFTRQNRPTTATDDPAAAVRSVTRTMIDYATTAKRNVHFVGEAQRTLQRAATELPGLTALKNIPDLVDRHVNGSARAVGQMVRFHALSSYAELTNRGIEPLKLNYTAKDPDEVTAARLNEVLGRTRLNEGIQLARAALDNQYYRYAFWYAQLQDAANHPYAAAITHEALDGLRPTDMG
jgi:hypothetical protein